MTSRAMPASPAATTGASATTTSPEANHSGRSRRRGWLRLPTLFGFIQELRVEVVDSKRPYYCECCGQLVIPNRQNDEKGS